MNRAGPRLRPRGVQVLAFCLALCVTPLGLPGEVIRRLGGAAWLAAVAVLMGGLAGSWASIRLQSRLRLGEPLVFGLRRLLGPLPGGTYAALLGALLAMGMPVNLGVFAQVVTTRELPYLPQAYAAGLLGSAATLAAYYGLETVVRAAEVLIPFIAVGVLLVFAASFAPAHYDVLPLGLPPPSSATGLLLVGCLGMARGFLAALVLGPLTRPRLGLGGLSLVSAAAAVLIGVSLILPLMVFSPAFAAALQFPFVTVTGTLVWQWLPAQKLEPFLLLIWQLLAFVVASAYPVLAAEVLAPLTALSRRLVSVGLGAAGTVASSVWIAPTHREDLALFWNLGVVFLGLAVPAAIALANPSRRAATFVRGGRA